MAFEYRTLDNGGRPFIAVWKPTAKSVEIYIRFYGYSTLKSWRGRLIARYEQVQQFLAGNCSILQTSARETKEWRGNTVLFTYDPRGAPEDFDEPEYLTQAPFRYVWVGASVLEFDLPERIIYYVGPVGNSGVPYPYAVTKSKTYLFSLSTIDAIENSKLPFTPPTYAKYVALCESKGYYDRQDCMHDYEVRAFDPACWLVDRDASDSLVEVSQLQPFSKERLVGPKRRPMGSILETLNKQQKRNALWTSLTFSVLGWWWLRRSFK